MKKIDTDFDKQVKFNNFVIFFFFLNDCCLCSLNNDLK